jgi:uncharacterized protein DUF6891
MEPQFELVGEMGLLILREVAAGFASHEEIIQRAVEMHGGLATEKELHELAEELAASAFYRHLKAQRGWPLVTDCDRFDLAFAQLEEKGIVVRHDLKDDAAEEFMDEMDRAADGSHPPRGYVFYQRRGTEAAIDGHGRYLDYGAAGDEDDDEDVNGNEQAVLRIGHEVAEALRRQGLAVDWNGSLSTRINVKLDWKRRRNWSDQD